jgi:DinB superfamily
MSSSAIAIKNATDLWFKQISRVSALFDACTDAQLATEIAPGRNSGYYLLGHLTAVHDAMLPLLRISDRLYPELEEPFIKNPDRSGVARPDLATVRNQWTTVTAALNKGMAAFSFDEWMERHASISAEDFTKEPHRNRFSVLLSRIAHLTEHIGQLLWINK